MRQIDVRAGAGANRTRLYLLLAQSASGSGVRQLVLVKEARIRSPDI